MSSHRCHQNDDNDDISHSRSDPGRRQRRHTSYRSYSASVAGPSLVKNIRYSFNPNEYEYGEGRCRAATGGSDTYSLIQRAARSALLDDVTPSGSTILTADDASDEENDRLKTTVSLQGGQISPNIKSLEKPSLPAIPDEQDRKRFVGCLAAVLSSMYDYESYEVLSENSPDSHNERENEISGFFDFYESSDEEDFVDDSSTSQRYKKEGRTETRNNAGERKFSSSSSTPSLDATDQYHGRKCKNFESIGSSTLTPPLLSKSKTTFRRQAANIRKMNGNGTDDNIADQKTKLSRERFLSRRYELYSELLLSSSELLLLDKSIARAFLPMLSRVLFPQLQKAQNGVADFNNGRSRSRTNRVLKQQSIPTDSKSKIENNEGVEEPSITIFNSSNVHFLDNIDELSPFLESLTPGSGFRCVSLLLLQHLLTSENGYDSRIRHALKKLSIVVLRRDMNDDPVEREITNNKNINRGQNPQPNRWTLNGFVRGSGTNQNHVDHKDFERKKLLQAARKFEALEQNIARRLILLSKPARNRRPKSNKSGTATNPSDHILITREQLVRGVKVGGAGILAGTLFALTGGLAAPGIASGVAAFAGAAAGTAAVSALTSAAVVTTIFGVGGGGLAAYKMQRRTQGVTEFEFCRETQGRPDGLGSLDIRTNSGDGDKTEAELFSILCISGWLRDQCDYQRPWGLQPTHPRIVDRLELLQRFYSIYSPGHIPKCERILNSWKGEEDKLWEILRKKYGRDPDNLFPSNDIEQENATDGTTTNGYGLLTLEQEEILDKLFVELGYHSIVPGKEAAVSFHREKPMSPFEKMRNGWKNRRNIRKSQFAKNSSDDVSDSMYGKSLNHKPTENPTGTSGNIQYAHESQSVSSGVSFQQQREDDSSYDTNYKLPEHLSTVWDWKTTYGGEMYTVKWESSLLIQICDCVTDLAVDVVTGATRQILKQTVLHTLLAAVVLPSYLLNLVNTIDGDWTIAVERADEAGIVLAKTLLYSRAGRRPVTLVGYSFGARIIYSCLKELARFQEEWEHLRELLEENNNSSTSKLTYHELRRLEKYKQKMKGMREPASIIEDAILMGLPNHLSLSSWNACRQVVAGRLVNCYSSNDLILSLMFQAKRFSGGSLNHGMGSILKPVCGTCRVEVPGVESINCSDIILGHQDYCLETGRILERIGLGEPIKFFEKPVLQ